MNGIETLRYQFAESANILESVMQDVTQAMADFLPDGLAAPIGWNYLHIASSNDWTLNTLLLEQPLLWERETWSAKVGVELPDPMVGPTREWLTATSISLEGARAYTEAVNRMFHAYLDTLIDADLDRVVMENNPYNTLGRIIAIYVNWHIAAHTGEIAVLKGIQGEVGYGF